MGRSVGSSNLPEQRHAGIADAETEHAARHGDQQTFRDQLADEPAASGADGEAQRHLARAHGRPAGQQSRDVGARDEQHGERERRQHRDQDRVRRILRDPRLQFGAHAEAAILVRVRIGARQIRGDGRQFGLRFSLGYPGLEASLEPQIPRVARFERTGLRIADETRRHHQRHEEISAHELVQAAEFGRGHANHRKLVAVDPHAAAEHVLIGSEFLLPHRPAEHDHCVASGHLIFFGPEGAADGRHDTHQREEVAAHQHAHLEFGGGLRIAGETCREIRERRQPIKALAAIADVHVVAVRRDKGTGAERFDGRSRTHGEHLARPGDRERPQQQRVSEAENGGVGADANREREDGDEGEPRTFREHPAAVAHVARDIVEPWQAALIAQRLHGLIDAASPDSRGSYSALGRARMVPLVLDGQLQMQPQFLFEVAIRTVPA